MILYRLIAFRELNDKVLETKENVTIETTERLNEIVSTLFIDECSLNASGNVTVSAENKKGTAVHVAKLIVIGKQRASFS